MNARNIMKRTQAKTVRALSRLSSMLRAYLSVGIPQIEVIIRHPGREGTRESIFGGEIPTNDLSKTNDSDRQIALAVANGA
jgi:hypothetical protein